RAAALARANLVANGTRNAEVRIGDVYAPIDDLVFDHILCNPPIRAGRAVVDRIISEAPSHLLDGGSLWLVACTRPGADTPRGQYATAPTTRPAASPRSGGEPRALRACARRTRWTLRPPPNCPTCSWKPRPADREWPRGSSSTWRGSPENGARPTWSC